MSTPRISIDVVGAFLFKVLNLCCMAIWMPGACSCDMRRGGIEVADVTYIGPFGLENQKLLIAKGKSGLESKVWMNADVG